MSVKNHSYNKVCKSTGDDDAMLLCDGCDHGYHTYCHQVSSRSRV